MNNSTTTGPGLMGLVVHKVFEIPLVLIVGGWVLRLLHHIYSLYLLIADYASKLNSTFRFVKRLRTDNIEFRDNIQKEVKNLKKIPSHLVLILGPETPSYGDIVKLITWCLSAGISHFSVYDHKEALDCWQIYEAFCGFSKQHLHNIKWGKSFNEEIKELSKNRINGYTWSPSVTVHLLEKSDGLQRVVNCVKQLHSEGVTNVKVQELNLLIRRNSGVPDPDLAVICGTIFSYYGCCPWNLRVTQFQMLKSHLNITATSFLNFLHEYSSSEQRYGK